MECGHPRNFFSTLSRRIFTVVEKLVSGVQLVIGLGFHSSATEVDHEALLLAFVSEIRRPRIHAPNCSLTDCDGYLRDILGGLTLAPVPSVFFGRGHVGVLRVRGSPADPLSPPHVPVLTVHLTS